MENGSAISSKAVTSRERKSISMPAPMTTTGKRRITIAANGYLPLEPFKMSHNSRHRQTCIFVATVISSRYCSLSAHK